ncbi:sulfotransferase family protein [Blastochloris viridis]|nr:sulfotransferase [Blastochloris viridis]ALK08147.1 hypothetical protein BVIR_348 [Blastochloris viridis]CUU44069.1 hypothetical protein BVIRIDIS_31150 [Blastochloris viridis]
METDAGRQVTVVTGLPRSGTSMVMRMLAEGGFPILTDGLRGADDDNVYGYFEYEPAKDIAHSVAWLDAAAGRAVKIVTPLVLRLPPDRPYRVLFIRRDLGAVIRSQDRMVRRRGGEPGEADWRSRLAAIEAETEAWCAAMPAGRTLRLRYEDTVAAPKLASAAICDFLGRDLAVAAMADAVAPPRPVAGDALHNP